MRALTALERARHLLTEGLALFRSFFHPPPTHPALAPTPDGVRYLSIAAGVPGAVPFHLRQLLPRVLGPHPTRWFVASRLSVLALAPLTALYTHSVLMAACVLLPGVLFNYDHTILVDGPALALTLAAACAYRELPTPVGPLVAAVLIITAAATRETTPLWAAIWLWTPVPLIALTIPIFLRFNAWWPPGDDVLDDVNRDILRHPIRAGREWHRNQWRAAGVMVLPWSGLVAGLAVLGDPSLHPQVAIQLVLSLALGYGQLVVATDSVRLYQWAFPSLALACVVALPPALLPFVALSLIFNPWR